MDFTSDLLLFPSAGAGRDAYFKDLSSTELCIGWLRWPHDDEPIASGDTVSVFWCTASAVVVNYLYA